jgi:hypothetical protein
MAAPKLAMAGKQAAQPIAETIVPSAPALSAMRVVRPIMLLPWSVLVETGMNGVTLLP